eukprot:8572029-Pyramimonas_sp.AAC.1
MTKQKKLQRWELKGNPKSIGQKENNRADVEKLCYNIVDHVVDTARNPVRNTKARDTPPTNTLASERRRKHLADSKQTNRARRAHFRAPEHPSRGVTRRFCFRSLIVAARRHTVFHS